MLFALRELARRADLNAIVRLRKRLNKSCHFLLVIPAKAGIQLFRRLVGELDPGFRRDDGLNWGFSSRRARAQGERLQKYYAR
jgi:hypothetical protein